MVQKPISLEYEPCSEPLQNSAKYLFLNREPGAGGALGVGEHGRKGLQEDVCIIVHQHEPVGLGFRVQGSGFRVQASGFRVQGSGLRVQGLGFRVQGSGFRVQG